MGGKGNWITGVVLFGVISQEVGKRGNWPGTDTGTLFFFSILLVRISDAQPHTCMLLTEHPESSFSSEAERKAHRYYLSCMDANKTVEKLGAQPLLDLMQQFKVNVSQFESPDDGWVFQDMLEKVHSYDISVLFSIWVGEDDKNSSRNIIQVCIKVR